MVDDDALVREYFAYIIEWLGLSCDTAADADEALGKILEAGSYDLCFVDWRMPGTDGLELARAVKGANAGQRVVLLASATEWDRMFGDADTTGADRFLPKPLFPSSVAACISECLTPERRPAADDANQAGSADDYAGRTILLAEDVEINREILLGLLEYTGITIDCACDGAQAVRMFSENPGRYGMIFMDVQMPEMDGYDATRAIRAMSAGRARNVPIVAMTANVFREDIEACRKAGMDDHVGKPLSREDVLEKLRRYLR
jgi:CheY-like chemotaxis protein